MTTDYHSALDLAVFHAINSDGGRFLDAAFLTLSAKWFGVLAGAAGWRCWLRSGWRWC